MSNSYINESKKVLLDTNLLAMYLVGLLGIGEIEAFKRTQSYTTDDAEVLNNALLKFNSIITTPHVLAETANLLDWFNGKKRQKLFEYLTNYIDLVEEVHQPAEQIVLSPAFLKLGLSDASLFDICHKQNCVLLTDDLELYSFAGGHGIEAINFNYLRNY